MTSTFLDMAEEDADRRSFLESLAARSAFPQLRENPFIADSDAHFSDTSFSQLAPLSLIATFQGRR